MKKKKEKNRWKFYDKFTSGNIITRIISIRKSPSLASPHLKKKMFLPEKNGTASVPMKKI